MSSTKCPQWLNPKAVRSPIARLGDDQATRPDLHSIGDHGSYSVCLAKAVAHLEWGPAALVASSVTIGATSAPCDRAVHYANLPSGPFVAHGVG
jgi:hypothetical protein